MNRQAMLSRVKRRTMPWDVVVIGGGATGMGCAVDAAARGYDVLLLEQHDFGKGTSSRSTKLAHGGVRYLEQGNISLVREALKERGLLRQNAPHLVRELAFIIPNYKWWEAPFYGLGLKIYQLLSGQIGFGPSHILSRGETLKRLPTINRQGLRGGVLYYDGQFDDARLLINLAATAAEQGATILNYLRVVSLLQGPAGQVTGVTAVDAESGEVIEAPARVVINATGAFCDELRRLAEPTVAGLITPSQGVHLVFAQSFLPGQSALMVPHTADGRVMFAIPWHGHTLVGTTDTPIPQAELEPRPLVQEIDFILATAGRYLSQAPTRNDILSVFVGVRPLVKSNKADHTAALSRDHTIVLERSKLLTITGGKWTTYRHMAEDCINHAAKLGGLPERPCVTARLPIHGFHPTANQFGNLAVYGSDAAAIQALLASAPELGEPLHPALPYCGAEVIWAVRYEMARSVEDVLARRTRALFLNAQAASEMAPRVAALLASELGQGSDWQQEQIAAFQRLAEQYRVTPQPLST